MPGEVRANLEHLTASAVQMDARGTEMAAEHTAAHGQIESASIGWVGRSASSLSSRLAQWQATVATLQARVIEHGQELHSASVAYAQTDQRSAEDLKQADLKVDMLAERQNL